MPASQPNEASLTQRDGLFIMSPRRYPSDSSQDPPRRDFEQILEAAKDGEAWAWASIYRDFAGPVTGYLASRGAPEPEDVTSETLLQVARNIQSFDGTESSFRSWVFVIAHRRLIDFRRAERRRVVATSLDAAVVDPAGGDVEQEAIDRLVTGEVEQALEALTDAQRDVLSLRVIAGLTVQETAQVLGKRNGAVKALQRRALVTLRKTLLRGVPT